MRSPCAPSLRAEPFSEGFGRLTARNIADLAGLDVGDVDGVLRDPGSLPAEKKYRLALAGSHLINAVNLARRKR